MTRINNQQKAKMKDFDGMMLFSATKHSEREVLGERVTEWRKANPDLEVVDRVVTQSSDYSFHCVTITVFYNHKKK